MNEIGAIQSKLTNSNRKKLLQKLRQNFKLDWLGIHGVQHWARVRYHGLRLAQETGADPLVVELFALLHDSCRDDDFTDKLHGLRAAIFAKSLQGHYFNLSDSQLTLLEIAIRGHSRGLVHENSTIQTCWDADRLDIGRVGTYPNPIYLSFAAMKYTTVAYEWSQGRKLIKIEAIKTMLTSVKIPDPVDVGFEESELANILRRITHTSMLYWEDSDGDIDLFHSHVCDTQASIMQYVEKNKLELGLHSYRERYKRAVRYAELEFDNNGCISEYENFGLVDSLYGLFNEVASLFEEKGYVDFDDLAGNLINFFLSAIWFEYEIKHSFQGNNAEKYQRLLTEVRRFHNNKEQQMEQK